MMVLLEDPTYASHSRVAVAADGCHPRGPESRGGGDLVFTLGWISSEIETIPATRRYRMAGSELMEVTGR